jgi:hypothetical protein
MFLFCTFFSGDVLVYYIAAQRAKVHRGVRATVIKVRALSFLQYHLSSQSMTINSEEIAEFYDPYLSRSFPQTQRHFGQMHWASSKAHC